MDGEAARVFRRSASRQAFDGVAAGCGGVLFLGFGLVLASGALVDEPMTRIFGLLGFGFFGVLMLAGAASAAQRGGDTRVAEVGPAGLWLPEMGFLAWPAIAQVRLERIRGVGGGDAPVTQQIRRLGVVPRDPSHRPSGATTLMWRMASLYYALVRAIAPQIRLGADDAAPFGVAESDVPKDFDEIVALVGRHASVVDVADIRARERAARWTTPEPGASVDDAALARIDEAISASATPVTATSATMPLVPPQPRFEPRATFTAPIPKPLEILFAILPVAAPLLVAVPFLLPQILGGGSSATFGWIFIGFLVVVFVLPGLVGLARLARRARAARTTTLRVGPDGAWTRDGGLAPWASVAEIRTERSGWVRSLGQPAIERWRLVVETTSGTTGGVASDELDARFDDVLDLVRFYHPVVERS